MSIPPNIRTADMCINCTHLKEEDWKDISFEGSPKCGKHEDCEVDEVDVCDDYEAM